MNTPHSTILILTFRTGGGHKNLAQSLKDRLSPTYNVFIADPYPAEVLQHYYTLLSRYFLWLWNLQYTYFDNKPMSLLLQSVLARVIRKQVIALVEQFQPQLIITTHSLLSYEVAQALKRSGRHIPLVFHLTDLEEVHTSWFTEKHADAYLAPTREIFAQALRQGIDKECVYITGRPIRDQFLHVSASEKAETLRKLGLDPARYTIFLQGGAEGSAGIERTVKSILAVDVPMQIILAVGNNKQLAERFADTERLYVLPFTEIIAPYMVASDIIAGKAGASFLTEAFMLEKPFLVTTFIPGQEGPGLRFLERYNLGWVCLDPATLKPLLTTITSNPSMMAEKVASIQAYRAWNLQANQRFLPIIEGLLAENNHASLQRREGE